MSLDKEKLKILISEGLLAASGFYGLSSAPNRNLQFAGPAYSISLLAGCVGVINVLTEEETVGKINEFTTSLCRALVIPLVATEICLANGVQKEFALLNLVYPICHILGKDVLGKEELVKEETLEVSKIISMGCIAYFAFVSSHEWGLILAAVYALSCGTILVDGIDQSASLSFLALGNFIYSTRQV